MGTVSIGSLNLTGTDADGSEWSIQKVDGWGATGPTVSFTQRARQSGAYASSSFSKNREVALNGTIVSPTRAAASAALDALYSAVTLGSTVLMIDDGRGSRWATVQQSGEIIPSWLNDFTVQYSVQVASTDWRKFGATFTGSTGLPSTSGGFTFPLTFPFTIDATVTSGNVSLTNPGNTVGPVMLRVDGPVAGPVITHMETQRTIAFQPGLALAAGEFLLIDPEAQTVLANGQVSRNAYLTSRQWFGFEPGPNTFAFSSANPSTAAQLTVEAIESWR